MLHIVSHTRMKEMFLGLTDDLVESYNQLSVVTAAAKLSYKDIEDSKDMSWARICELHHSQDIAISQTYLGESPS